jgi:hypothetical protein
MFEQNIQPIQMSYEIDDISWQVFLSHVVDAHFLLLLLFSAFDILAQNIHFSAVEPFDRHDSSCRLYGGREDKGN